ncbi:MAG TPA: YceI family protein [Blastocatellia bacterium]|nr:YceI family protein [Blastocatellia bacterium]
MSIAYRRAKRFAAALITLLCAGAFASPAAAPLSEGRYKINAAESRFTVRALVGGLLSSVAGHDHTIAIRDFYGTAQFTYGSVTPASLQFTVKADSLAVTDKVSESDRNKIQTTMRNEVLDVGSYPEITFKSTEITATRVEEGKYEARISGDLTLHGTTRQLTIHAFVTFYATSLHADGQFALRQTEYGIRPVSVAGGTIKVKDELKFSFHIVAER